MVKTKSEPQLKQFVGFWTLTGQPVGGQEWSVEEKIRRAREAGFVAMSGGARADIANAVRAAGMDYICNIDANDQTWREQLEAAATTKCARVNVQLWDHDTPPRVAVKTWIKMTEAARKMKLEIDLEVHRDTCTETPEKTWEIARLFQQATGRRCRFCFDFSHFAVVKHIAPPYANRLLEHPELIRLARQMHFRPFNGHHCQVPMTDGRGNLSPEGRHYLEFVDALLACWLKGARGGEVLYVCPENGPIAHGYGLSCFPNVWDDA
ncbi:MAG: xylose isomerase, partial [Verrucomicrobiae bacterium]|nr:xylose isomerase [Verrucomicrobiae bacterium]